jgi:histidinol-phosphate aminotransferase
VVLLDEAYGEFSSVQSFARAASRSSRLVVIRTLSKAFGLAGLRVGWAVAAPSLVAELEKTRGPYKVGGVAERAALTALTEDRQWVRGCVDQTLALRARFVSELNARGLKTLPSEANFVLVPVTRPADGVATRMRERGVSVRAFPALDGIGEAVRITIGPWEQLSACLDALTEATR